MLGNERVLQCGGLVEIALSALFERQLRHVNVVVIEIQDRCIQTRSEPARKLRFPRAGGTGDPDQMRPHTRASPNIHRSLTVAAPLRRLAVSAQKGLSAAFDATAPSRSRLRSGIDFDRHAYWIVHNRSFGQTLGAVWTLAVTGGGGGADDNAR